MKQAGRQPIHKTNNKKAGHMKIALDLKVYEESFFFSYAFVPWPSWQATNHLHELLQLLLRLGFEF